MDFYNMATYNKLKQYDKNKSNGGKGVKTALGTRKKIK